ncbi:ATP-binding protein [Desulfatitalea alkaliphila]|uniref:histidine kinase n=1 Tax=Desulfatitalea alkaliphila TaxID=2929485 RepID=A0AA41R3H5_9BACT|nr:ATP-binding protein [Desulfatitalea alkaliphila]MCJ8502279.1 ATP-binding protein [Desulfatitalea alkaliphila]
MSTRQDSTTAAPLGKTAPAMVLHPVTLRFAGNQRSLEPPFLTEYARRARPQVRLAALLATLFYGLFAVLDAIVAPDAAHRLWFVRFAVVCPIFLLVWLFTYSRHFLHYMQAGLAVGVLSGGGGIIYMTATGNSLMAGTYYAGLMLVLMMAYGFIWARFIWATVCGWLLLLTYGGAAAWSNALPTSILAGNLFFCTSANLIGMVVCYAFEFYTRRDYYMRHLLDIQHREVTAAKSELEQRVAERTRLLALANEDLRREIQVQQRLAWEKQVLEGQLRQAQKMEAIGTLAGGIAHDFNNMLAAIMGHTELALMAPDNPREVSFSMEQVLKASERARELVGQILSFSRQSEGQHRPLHIGPVVKEALRLLRATLPASIALEKDIAARESMVVADATQMHQIVINLCTNAAHAMASGGGRLQVTLSDVEIGPHLLTAKPEPSSLPPGKYVCLQVTDTGQGIEEHLMERIFDPYFTTKEKGVGTGLGLAVVRGIVEHHGGVIDVQSHVGRGTTVRVFLQRIEGADAGAPGPVAPLNHGHETILLVDDEEGLAALGAKLLTALGYRVAAFTSPETALTAFKADPDRFDLVITDMIMPGIDGEALARQILALRPGTPVILYSGYTDMVSTARLEALGIRAVLRKPITIHALSRAVRQVLSAAPAAPGRTD